MSTFQSTCLREARLGPVGALVYLAQFQSTCLREARPTTPDIQAPPGNFNPRAYVRHDQEILNDCLDIAFQSTCLREARRDCFCHGLPLQISIHVPT